jgi:hypothetical protein
MQFDDSSSVYNARYSSGSRNEREKKEVMKTKRDRALFNRIILKF